jgi:tetratricopeptide (TPR) repeat protein
VKIRVAWLVAALLTGLIAAAGGLWMRSHSRRPPGPAADRLAAGLTASALAESVDAAHARRDWLSAIRWGRSLVDRAPRSSDALCDLALAVHNVSLVSTPAEGGPKPPLRNSLQRIRYDDLAIALMDSSLACAIDLGDWTRAERYLGNFYEILGLPLEALERYEAILARAPRDSVALARRYWVATHLMDPRATDFPRFESRADPLPHRVRRSSGR